MSEQMLIHLLTMLIFSRTYCQFRSNSKRLGVYTNVHGTLQVDLFWPTSLLGESFEFLRKHTALINHMVELSSTSLDFLVLFCLDFSGVLHLVSSINFLAILNPKIPKFLQPRGSYLMVFCAGWSQGN